ncbi:tRNA (guanine(10)-N2)-methyltransferase homolog isoform X2 [Schistocerca cancellata]|uniref:tRNA (guanine(10)-N2)-methyltransferase homolog isoform X2 n=1 Tax=Schistocerca cancellata TaxID=274614 RepID=UPI002118988F|nr:tRNA (guanine(10)-N2)-methyltransferase homolog isoform X2 [Schistocerca cancellata]
MLKRYLLWFANEHIEFRIPEIESISSLFSIQLNWVEKHTYHPYCIIDLHDEEAALQIASRSVALRWCLELWARAKTDEELHRNLKSYPHERMKPFLQDNLSFKIKVETFCNSQTQEEKVSKIESFSYLPLKGPVRLKNPDVVLQYIEYYGQDSNRIPEKPYDLFFGRWIADGQRDLITKLSLKTRKFIGNTSMDPQLSLLMANQARVQEADLVLDPFVGSGSLLVAAAQFGGYVLGTDIDYLMLHGKTRPTRIQKKKKRDEDESIRTNLKQYGRSSQYIDVIVADSSLPVWHPDFKVDAIVTDPPYGIREATERIGSTKSYQISEEHLQSHIPSKVVYGLQQIYCDLLNFAANHLVIEGRLVCWIPVVRSEYSEEKLPTHPQLELIANSEQILSVYTSRRLLTFKKVAEKVDQVGQPDCEALTAEFREKFFRFGEEVRKYRKLHKNEMKTVVSRNEPTREKEDQ